jgi:hypothetical protein
MELTKLKPNEAIQNDEKWFRDKWEDYVGMMEI